MIREAKETDISALQAIYTAAQSENFHWLSSEEISQLDIKTDTEGEKIWVAVIENDIVGFISVWEQENFIHHLFVHPSHAGKKIGKKLLSHALAIIGRPAALKCISLNQPALAFYKSQGWVTAHIGNDGDIEYEKLELHEI